MSTDRYIRQSGMFSQEKLNKHLVTIIGVGAIGRNVAIQLTAMGVENIMIFDPDKVEEHNVASQGYRSSDIGKDKVIATRLACNDINSNCNMSAYNKRFNTRFSTKNHVVFMCVDSISTRKFLFEHLKKQVALMIDVRMAAESFRVLTIGDIDSADHYEKTLFSQDEAFQQSCTSKSTIYCANIAAGFAISSFTKWIRNVPTDKDVFVNLFAGEMTYPEER